MSNKIISYEKSFASHKKSKFWSNKNNISPNKITKGSKKSYYFNCDKCNNHFKSIIYNIVKSKKEDTKIRHFAGGVPWSDNYL